MRSRETAPPSYADFCTILIQAGSEYQDMSSQWAYYTTNSTLCDNYLSVGHQFCEMDPWFVRQFANTCFETGEDKFWHVVWIILQVIWWSVIAGFVLYILILIAVPIGKFCKRVYRSLEEKILEARARRAEASRRATEQSNTNINLGDIEARTSPGPHTVGEESDEDDITIVA